MPPIPTQLPSEPEPLILGAFTREEWRKFKRFMLIVAAVYGVISFASDVTVELLS